MTAAANLSAATAAFDNPAETQQYKQQNSTFYFTPNMMMQRSYVIKNICTVIENITNYLFHLAKQSTTKYVIAYFYSLTACVTACTKRIHI